MNPHVNEKLIVRLLLAWILLSILIGTAVFFIEAKKIDAYVVELATEESSGFITGARDDLNSPEPLRRERLYRESMQHIEGGHFIADKFYNRDKAMIIEANHPAVRSIEKVITRHRREMDLTDAVHSRKFYGDGGQIYVLVVMPLKTADRKTAGYFEGVYKVPLQTMAELKNRIILSLLQVVVIIFFTTLTIYPIVLTLNRRLIRRTRELFHANIGMLKVLGTQLIRWQHALCACYNYVLLHTHHKMMKGEHAS